MNFRKPIWVGRDGAEITYLVDHVDDRPWLEVVVTLPSDPEDPPEKVSVAELRDGDDPILIAHADRCDVRTDPDLWHAISDCTSMAYDDGVDYWRELSIASHEALAESRYSDPFGD